MTPVTGVRSDVFLATEHLQGWVALDTEALAEFGLLCAVNLDELDVLLLQRGRSLFVLRGEGFAVSASCSLVNWMVGTIAATQ
jgi:hypothetical protein